MVDTGKLFVDADVFVALNDKFDPNYNRAVDLSNLAGAAVPIPLLRLVPACFERPLRGR